MGPCILVVEDDEATAEVIDLVLADAGYTVVHAADGQAALHVLTTTQPQLVLSDVHMPGMDGRRLCQTLAADPRYAAIPRVLMSIWRDASDALPCVTAVLPKPFLPSVLLATVQRYVPARVDAVLLA